MQYIEISEPVFRDLIGCKSKLEDIKVMLNEINPRITKQKFMEQLTLIVYSSRYQDKEGDIREHAQL